uniref:Ycf36 n=1 Tax=Glaucocystis incrassata TaxID=1789788 RepID=A0A3G1IVM2_9EUKA|nr:hypothetical protein Ycf36 [Glaucocystis incrassata]ASQ40095.1 hypothetical protein Ycf36 [Glaucocystis incrassata]
MICPVPLEQRPLHEYLSLRNSCFFCWATQDGKKYISYLFIIWCIGWIITICIYSTTFLFFVNPLNLFLKGCIGASLLLSLNIVRLYLGWSYVGQRLLSATVRYEESGWYDGQIWIKSPEVLIQDRLIGIYQVNPLLNRLRRSLGQSLAFLTLSILFTFVTN